MDATINVLNSDFSSTTEMQHEKYLFHKALSFRINKKNGGAFWEKTQKKPLIECTLIMAQ